MLEVLLLGVLVGITLGVLGGGGSTLAIPLLTYVVGLGPREAIATSLIVVGLAALVGAAHHWRRGALDMRCALTFGVLGFLGSATGAQAARYMRPDLQMTLFALTLIATALLMLRGRTQPESRASGGGFAKTAAAAIGAGLLTGVVGVGGGFIVVPALVFVAGLPMRRAIGTSLLVIVFNSFGGLMSYVAYVKLDSAVWIPFAASAMVASLGGTLIGRQLGEKRLRTAFAVGLILLGLLTIAQESHFLS